jgi:HEAT repeat protein
VPVSFLSLIAISAAALAQLGQVDIGQPAAITIRLGSEDTVSFRLSQRVVTDIELHVRGAEYSVPLQCAGGLRDVNAETAAISASEGERAKSEGSFALLFDMGNEQDRRFGKLPRVQLSFYRGRLTEMLVTTMTSARSAFSSKLCSSVPVGPITCEDTRQLQGLAPEALVQQLRDLPARIGALGPALFSDAERKRESIYEELLDWGGKSIPALVAGLKDPDVRLRRHAALAFGVLGGGWYQFECGPARMDIRSAMSALVIAFGDSDPDVRAWAAQAVGDAGADAVDAVPALTDLLKNGDEGSRNSACMALGQIGPAAKAALPALRAALSDKSQPVRRFAARAIQRIEQ